MKKPSTMPIKLQIRSSTSKLLRNIVCNSSAMSGMTAAAANMSHSILLLLYHISMQSTSSRPSVGSFLFFVSPIDRIAGGHTVLPATLAEIKLLVCLCDQGEVVQLCTAAAGDAEGGSNDTPSRQIVPRDGGGTDCADQLNGDAAGLFLVGVGQNDDEFLAAETEKIAVGCLKDSDYAAGKVLERLVSLQVGIMVVVRLEIIYVADDDADLLRRQLPDNVLAVGVHRLFVQRPRHHIVIGKLEEGIAHAQDGPFVGRLAEEDGSEGNKADNDGKAQKKMLEQIIVFRIGELPGKPPAGDDQSADNHGIYRFVGGRGHDGEQVAH